MAPEAEPVGVLSVGTKRTSVAEARERTQERAGRKASDCWAAVRVPERVLIGGDLTPYPFPRAGRGDLACWIRTMVARPGAPCGRGMPRPYKITGRCRPL